jgi:hypothetical protein
VDKDNFTFIWVRAVFSEHFVVIISLGKFYFMNLRKWKFLTAVILMQ